MSRYGAALLVSRARKLQLPCTLVRVENIARTAIFIEGQSLERVPSTSHPNTVIPLEPRTHWADQSYNLLIRGCIMMENLIALSQETLSK